MSDVRRGSAYQFRTVPESETCDDTFDIKYLHTRHWQPLGTLGTFQRNPTRYTKVFFSYTKALGLERVRRASSYICPFRSILIRFIIIAASYYRRVRINLNLSNRVNKHKQSNLLHTVNQLTDSAGPAVFQSFQLKLGGT